MLLCHASIPILFIEKDINHTFFKNFHTYFLVLCWHTQSVWTQFIHLNSLQDDELWTSLGNLFHHGQLATSCVLWLNWHQTVCCTDWKLQSTDCSAPMILLAHTSYLWQCTRLLNRPINTATFYQPTNCQLQFIQRSFTYICNMNFNKGYQLLILDIPHAKCYCSSFWIVTNQTAQKSADSRPSAMDASSQQNVQLDWNWSYNRNGSVDHRYTFCTYTFPLFSIAYVCGNVVDLNPIICSKYLILKLDQFDIKNCEPGNSALSSLFI